MSKRKPKILSKKEIDQILTEYLDKPVKRLANEIGTSYSVVMRVLKEHDLTIPKEIIEQRKNMGRFKKGQVSYNKGLKQSEFMSSEAIEKTKKTR